MKLFTKHPIIIKPKNKIEADFGLYWRDFINEINQQYNFYVKSPTQAPIGCGAIELPDGKIELIKYRLNFDFDLEYLSFKLTSNLYNRTLQNSYVIYTVKNREDFNDLRSTVSKIIFLENNKIHCNFGKAGCRWIYRDQDGKQTKPIDDSILEKWSPKVLSPADFLKHYK